jgi:malonyl-CoA O-methyltransferase
MKVAATSASQPPIRPFDARAAHRLRLRLAAAEQPPWLHCEVADRLAQRLAIIKRPPRRVLDWSGAAMDSRAALAKTLPDAALERVLQAHAQADSAQGKSWLGRLKAAWPRVRTWPVEAVPEGAFDMVWSDMSLHWADDPTQVFQAWRRALAPEGFVMFSSLGPGTLGRLRALYRAADWGEAMAPMTDMHDLGDMLVEAGFADPVMDQETLNLSWSSPQTALAELRTLGANVHGLRHAGCRTPRWRAQLESALLGCAGADGRIKLEFEVVYGHAYRAADAGPRVAASTHIGLDQMRALLRRKPSI